MKEEQKIKKNPKNYCLACKKELESHSEADEDESEYDD